tara:strand:- start:505 stop:972 length:468 start_codon:yes stop_codon:yes gene_type:complete
MFKSNKHKLESLEEHVYDLKGYVEACGRDIAAFKREIRQDIIDLQYTRAEIDEVKGYVEAICRDIAAFKTIQPTIYSVKAQLHDLREKHDEAVESGGTAVAQIQQDISLLKSRVEMLDKWDDETRDKFRSLMDYFEISFTDGRRVVERGEEDSNH